MFYISIYILFLSFLSFPLLLPLSLPSLSISLSILTIYPSIFYPSIYLSIYLSFSLFPSVYHLSLSFPLSLILCVYCILNVASSCPWRWQRWRTCRRWGAPSSTPRAQSTPSAPTPRPWGSVSIRIYPGTWYSLNIVYFSLKCCDFSELCQICRLTVRNTNTDTEGNAVHTVHTLTDLEAKIWTKGKI